MINAEEEKCVDAMMGQGNHARKVFLLNTHLDYIINAPMEMVAKLRQIFSLFRGRDDVVLLWRPHPLTMSTIRAMKPEVCREYMELIDEFLSMRNGIYDDSSELERAIAVSDAYIGHLSSVVALFGITGKPVYLWEPLRESLSQFVAYSVVATAKEGWIYFSTYYFNGLFRLEMSTNQIEYLGIFEKEHGALALHLAIHAYENELWFIPKMGKYITKLNRKTWEREYAAFLPDHVFLNRMDEFRYSLQIDHVLWLVPGVSDCIVKLDMRSGEACEYRNWPEGLKMRKGEYNFRGAVAADNKLWLCPYKADKLVCFDTISGEMKAFAWEYPEMSFGGVAYDGECLWFSPMTYDAVLKYNPVTGETRAYRNFPEGVDAGQKDKFSDIRFIDGYLWLIPYFADMILRMDARTGAMKGISGYSERLGYAHRRREYGNLPIFAGDGMEVMACAMYADAIVAIDTKGAELQYYDLKISEETMEDCLNRTLEHDKDQPHATCVEYVDRERYRSAQAFIQNVCEGRDRWREIRVRDFEKNTVCGNGDCGNTVWNDIRKRIEVTEC